MREKTGIVVSTKMEKTIVVRVSSSRTHPKYKKRYSVSRNFSVHVEDTSVYAEGDTVIIQETRPMSKTKCWKVAVAA